MENHENKKKDEGPEISWLTRPCYNLMLVSLVILYSFEKYLDHSIITCLQVCLWIPLVIIIVANVWGFFDLIKYLKKPKEENKIDLEEE